MAFSEISVLNKYFNNFIYMNNLQSSHIIKNKDILSLDTLLLLNLGGLFAIRNDDSMKVHVSYSTNILVSLGRILSDSSKDEFKLLKEDIETSKIDILTTDSHILSDVKMKKLYTTLYTEQYKSNGYTLYKPSRSVQYTLRTCIKSYRHTAYLVVELVNARNDILIVGVFPNKRECNAFIDKYYPGEVVTGFFYDSSDLTKELSRHF